MHRTIGYLSKRFVQVRPGEGRRVLLTFTYFFLIITAYYVIKPASRSLVLGELGSRMVPYVDLICAMLMGPIVTLFARLVDRLPKPQLVSRSFVVVIGVVLAFWYLLHWEAPWVAGAFYIWVAIFSVLVVTLFWLVANDLYRPRDAKRLFGFIGSGGILGGIVGSSIAAVGAQVIGTRHLLLACAVLLGACWWVVQQLWRLAPARLTAEEPRSAAAHRDTFLSDVRGFGRLLAQSRYLLLLVALVGLNKLVATLIYYQLNPFIEQAFPLQDARTSFTAFFFGSLNVLAFVIQFFFTSWILRRFGLAVTLIALPIGLLLGTSALLVLPSLWIAAATELYDGSMNYSLQQTTKEVLYLPIDRAIRYKVKPFIDMVVFRFGKGLAAIIGIVLLDGLHVPVRFLSCVAIPLIVAWLIVATWLRRDYVATIRTMLQARAAARRSRTGAAWAGIAADLGSASPSQKMALLDRLVSSAEGVSPTAKELLDQLKLYEVRGIGMPSMGGELQQLKAMLCDPHEHLTKRCHAIECLVRSPNQDVVDILLGVVMLEADARLRQEAVRALVTLRLRGSHRLDFPVEPIRRQIAHEVANYQRIKAVAVIYQRHHRGVLPEDDPAVALLRTLLEESSEQVFRLLMLLYRAEDMHLIYEQLRTADAYLRADALELLDNLVDPAMRSTLLPLLDEDEFLSMAASEEAAAWAQEPTAAYRVLQEAIWDHNYWLSITTLCAVGRLRLTTLRQELERATRHTIPVVSSAAKVALYLSAHP